MQRDARGVSDVGGAGLVSENGGFIFRACERYKDRAESSQGDAGGRKVVTERRKGGKMVEKRGVVWVWCGWWN